MKIDMSKLRGLRGECEDEGDDSGDEQLDEPILDFKTACAYSSALSRFALLNNMPALSDTYYNAKQEMERSFLRKRIK